MQEEVELGGMVGRLGFGLGMKKAQSLGDWAFEIKPGDFLLSHTVACAVPSGLRSLTSVFGMGTGGSSSLGSPRTGDPRSAISFPLRNLPSG